MERVEQDLKLEGSFDEMRRAKSRIANRTNLMQILLNATVEHTNSEIVNTKTETQKQEVLPT